jgi:hypothetical protein
MVGMKAKQHPVLWEGHSILTNVPWEKALAACSREDPISCHHLHEHHELALNAEPTPVPGTHEYRMEPHFQPSKAVPTLQISSTQSRKGYTCSIKSLPFQV